MIENIFENFNLFLTVILVLFLVQLTLDLALTKISLKVSGKYFDYEDLAFPSVLQFKNYIFLIINTAYIYVLLLLTYLFLINNYKILDFFIKGSSSTSLDPITPIVMSFLVGGLLLFVIGQLIEKFRALLIFSSFKPNLIAGKIHYKRGYFFIEYRNQYFLYSIIFSIISLLTFSLAFSGAAYFSICYFLSSKKTVERIQKTNQKAFGDQ